MKRLKALAFQALTFIFKHTVGRGFGKIPFATAAYNSLYRRLAVSELILKINGSKMIMRISDADGVSYHLLYYRDGLEKYETKLFKRLIKKDMTVIDIGANIGYYTLLSARLAGNKGKVFAFEPEAENYNLLIRNVELNEYKNVTPVKKAVSSNAGKADLFLNKETGAHGFLPDRDGVVGVTTVDTVSLDEYFKHTNYPIDIIKIDVEGSELAALAGMQNIIKHNANLIIFTEFWPWGLQKSGFPPREYWDKLVESGFKFIYLINEKKQRLELADFSSVIRYCEDTSLSSLPSANLLCTKVPLSMKTKGN